jgi:hypothetical protein
MEKNERLDFAIIQAKLECVKFGQQQILTPRFWRQVASTKWSYNWRYILEKKFPASFFLACRGN